MAKTITHILTEQEYEETGGQTGKILSRIFGLSRHEISRLKFAGEILCSGRRMHVNEIIHADETLTAVFPEEAQHQVACSSAEPDILYEDEDLVILNKPAGIPVHAVHGHLADSLGTILQSYYGHRGISFTVRCVGRLDKDVSGIMLYAKNQPAGARLTDQRQKGILHKTYLAFAEGIFPEREFTLEDAIAKEAGQRARVISEDGKKARTHGTVLQEFSDQYSLLQISIETGRTHQIRIHCAASGHPLLGDTLYGGSTLRIDRPALHCASIELISPFSGNHVLVQAPLPKDLQQLMQDSVPAGIPEEI